MMKDNLLTPHWEDNNQIIEPNLTIIKCNGKSVEPINYTCEGENYDT